MADVRFTFVQCRLILKWYCEFENVCVNCKEGGDVNLQLSL